MTPEAAAARDRAVRAMTFEQKLLVAESLRVFAWELKRAVIQRRHPELGESEILQRVRAAFGNDRA
jgi:hypothetical protein